jgi:chemotaxis protein histidine kinase CheA
MAIALDFDTRNDRARCRKLATGRVSIPEAALVPAACVPAPRRRRSMHFDDPHTAPYPAPAPNTRPEDVLSILRDDSHSEHGDIMALAAHASLQAEVALEELAVRFLTMKEERDSESTQAARDVALANAEAVRRALEAEQQAAQATFAASFAQEAAFEAVRERHQSELASAIAEARQLAIAEVEAAHAEATETNMQRAEAARNEWLESTALLRWERSALQTSLWMWAAFVTNRAHLLRAARDGLPLRRYREWQRVMDTWSACTEDRRRWHRQLTFAASQHSRQALRVIWNVWTKSTLRAAQHARWVSERFGCPVARTMRRPLDRWRHYLAWRATCVTPSAHTRRLAALGSIPAARRALSVWMRATSERRAHGALTKALCRRMDGMSHSHYQRRAKRVALAAIASAAYRGQVAGLCAPVDPWVEAMARHRELLRAVTKLQLHALLKGRARACWRARAVRQAFRSLQAVTHAEADLTFRRRVLETLQMGRRMQRCFDHLHERSKAWRFQSRLVREEQRSRCRACLGAWARHSDNAHAAQDRKQRAVASWMTTHVRCVLHSLARIAHERAQISAMSSRASGLRLASGLVCLNTWRHSWLRYLAQRKLAADFLMTKALHAWTVHHVDARSLQRRQLVGTAGQLERGVQLALMRLSFHASCKRRAKAVACNASARAVAMSLARAWRKLERPCKHFMIDDTESKCERVIRPLDVTAKTPGARSSLTPIKQRRDYRTELLQHLRQVHVTP